MERELEGIGEKIEHDLLPHIDVHVDGLRQRQAVDSISEASAFHGGAEYAGQLGGAGGEVHRAVEGLNAPGFNAREVEQRIDELRRESVAMDSFDLGQVFLRDVLASFVEDFFERTEHQGERSAELVADVRKKMVFARSSSASASARRRSCS